MVRRRGYVLGVVAIVAMMVLGILPSLAGAGGLHAVAHASLGQASSASLLSSHRAAAASTAPHASPAASGTGPVSVSATQVTTSASQTLNVSFTYMLNVTNASIDFNNVTLYVNLSWAATNALVANATSCTTSATCTATNQQFPLAPAPLGNVWGKSNRSAQETITWTFGSAWLTSLGFNGGNWPQGNYNLNITAWVKNSSNVLITPVQGNWTYAFFLQNDVLTLSGITTGARHTIPFTYWYSLNLTNAAIDGANVSVTVKVVWAMPGCGSGTLFGGVECPVVASATSCPGACANNSTQFQLPKAALGPVYGPVNTRAATEMVPWTITAATLTSGGAFSADGNQFAQGVYQFQVWVNSYTNSSNALSMPVNGNTPVTPPAVSYQTNIVITEPTITIITPLPLYASLPANLVFSVGVTNTTPTAGNIIITVEVQFVLTTGPQLVVNTSIPINDTSTTYTVAITKAFLSAQHFGGGQLPTGSYLTTVWLTATNGAALGSSAWSGVTTGRSQTSYFIITPMNATFLSPSSNSQVALGNVTFSIVYQGDFVNGANLTVYSGSVPLFVTGIFHSGTGPQTAVVSWPAAGPGAYKAVVTLTAPQQTPAMFALNFSVVASSTAGVTYINHSVYQNATLIPGLTPAVAGALLLIIGLIIGMIVALLLGRMMWGSTRPQAPQQWTPKPANECAVCHQTFATEAEMRDHAKVAHGVT